MGTFTRTSVRLVFEGGDKTVGSRHSRHANGCVGQDVGCGVVVLVEEVTGIKADAPAIVLTMEGNVRVDDRVGLHVEDRVLVERTDGLALIVPVGGELDREV